MSALPAIISIPHRTDLEAWRERMEQRTIERAARRQRDRRIAEQAATAVVREAKKPRRAQRAPRAVVAAESPCVNCGAITRSGATGAQRRIRGMCRACYNASRRRADGIPPKEPVLLACPDCGRMTRSTRQSLTAFPGTVRRRGGKCERCNAMAAELGGAA